MVNYRKVYKGEVTYKYFGSQLDIKVIALGQPKGCKTWNKGLTKETDERVARYGKNQSATKKQLIKEGKLNPTKNLPEPKIKISREEMINLYKELGNQNEVAKFLNVRQSAISQFMLRRDIRANPKHIWKNRDPKKQAEINKKISKSMKGNINWRYSHEFPNGDERKLINFFREYNFPFTYVGDGRFKIKGKCPDFIWKRKKRIIEFFGDIWHRKSDEPSRIDFFRYNGWNCLVIWGREIRKSGWKDILNKKIEQWLSK